MFPFIRVAVVIVSSQRENSDHDTDSLKNVAQQRAEI